MKDENAPEHVEEAPTAPDPPRTNQQLVYGDRFADDADFKETLRWDRESAR